MHGYIDRLLAPTIRQKLEHMPVVAVLGPRQCGKSTLARVLTDGMRQAIYLDLERPSDRNKLTDPEAFFDQNHPALVCLDEIQQTPELFPVIRSHVDTRERPGQFLVLGSASPELLRQSSETLAGRIAYLELTPFLLPEMSQDPAHSLRQLWLRGGFPRSLLARSDRLSIEWRLDFIRTFLERDVPQLGLRILARTLERFWQMCAHSHGQLLNQSKLGDSIGVSHHTVRGYLEVLEQTFLVRTLLPFEANLKKRLIKAPKLFVRDSGVLHAMLGIETQNDLLGHPVYGSSWEGLVVEHVLASFPTWRAGYYRTQAGAEIDLILEKGARRVAIECKASSAPNLGRGFYGGLADLGIQEAFVVAPVKGAYPLAPNVTALPLADLLARLRRD